MALTEEQLRANTLKAVEAVMDGSEVIFACDKERDTTRRENWSETNYSPPNFDCLTRSHYCVESDLPPEQPEKKTRPLNFEELVELRRQGADFRQLNMSGFVDRIGAYNDFSGRVQMGGEWYNPENFCELFVRVHPSGSTEALEVSE